MSDPDLIAEHQRELAAIAAKQRRDTARITELESDRDYLLVVARNMNTHIEELLARNLIIATEVVKLREHLQALGVDSHA